MIGSPCSTSRELTRDPAAFKTCLLAGLGAEAQELAPEDLEPVRVAARPRSFALARAAKLGAGVLRRVRAEALLGRLKSDPAVERALFSTYRADERPVMSTGDLCYLRAILEPDARALDAMLGTSFRQDWWHESNVNGPERP